MDSFTNQSINQSNKQTNKRIYSAPCRNSQANRKSIYSIASDEHWQQNFWR